MSRRTNPRLASALQDVPGVGSLAAAKLVRGLPGGQAVRHVMRLPPPRASAFDGQGLHSEVVGRDLGWATSAAASWPRPLTG